MSWSFFHSFRVLSTFFESAGSEEMCRRTQTDQLIPTVFGTRSNMEYRDVGLPVLVRSPMPSLAETSKVVKERP